MNILPLQIERRTLTHSHTPLMDPNILAMWYCGTHDIACLKTKMTLTSGEMSYGKARGVCATPLAVSSPHACDEAGLAREQVKRLRRTRPHAGRVKPVPLGERKACAVVLRASTRPTLHWQTRGTELAGECPPGRVDRCRVFERLFGLGLNLREPELCGGLRAFLLVAWATGQHQVGHTV